MYTNIIAKRKENLIEMNNKKVCQGDTIIITWISPEEYFSTDGKPLFIYATLLQS